MPEILAVTTLSHAGQDVKEPQLHALPAPTPLEQDLCESFRESMTAARASATNLRQGTARTVKEVRLLA